MRNIVTNITDELHSIHELLYNTMNKKTSNAGYKYFQHKFESCWDGFNIREELDFGVKQINYTK